jgi:hypothetical protein
MKKGKPMRQNCVLIVFATLVLGACQSKTDSPGLAAEAGTSGQIERFELEGGPVVLLVRVEGVPRVAVQALYDVGIVDEPKGLAQASHLIEHLACVGATAQSPAGYTFQSLNQIGMANAETLPSLTHYDYGLPADRFELAIQTEAERLRSLAFEPKTIAQEAARCYQEVQAVAGHDPPMVGKFALMAAAQAWRHAATYANVRKGIESAFPDALRAFHARHYHRGNLTLVIAGPVERKTAEEAVRRHFADLPSPNAAPQPIAWDKASRHSQVVWDGPATVLYFAYPPSGNLAERMLATACFDAIRPALTNDADVLRLASAVDFSGLVWPVGRSPSFAAFTLRPGVSWKEAEPKLRDRLRAALANLRAEALAPSLPMYAELPWKLDAQFVRGNLEPMTRQLGSQDRAYDAILGNAAIQIGLREVWLGKERKKPLQEATVLLQNSFEQFRARIFAENKEVVTALVPAPGVFPR